MTADNRCFLVRHGETEWSRSGRHTGRTDLPLLPEGVAQAERLAPVLKERPWAVVLTSPLLRARQTSALAGWAEVAEVDPDLAEWDYGAFEGLTTSEIRSVHPGWDLFADGALEGESAEDVGRRADRIIARVRQAPGDVVCFAHGHILRVMAARWIGLPATGGGSLTLSPASLSELGWERERPVIALWNCG
jgi:broad specificity phosphatase PhoE